MRWVVRSHYASPETYADRYLVSEDTFAIADGMGVGRGAILAAEKAVGLIEEMKPFRSEEEIRKAFEKVNKEIIRELGVYGDELVSGTTLSVLSVLGDKFVVGHVGDSRIYLLREGKMELLTEDQVNYKNGRKRVKVLGLDWNPPVYTKSGEAREGDLFLLISDGFVKAIDEEVLMELINPDYLEESAENIIRTFSETLSGEDLTFILLKL